MTTKEIQNWTVSDWQTKVAYAKPSGGGAVGVVFVWVVPKNADASSKPPTADFVIKPMQGSAAPTKFAEHVLSAFAGAASPNSKPVQNKSQEGMALLNTLKVFRMKETDAAVKQRWTEVMNNYTNASHFLIQDLQVGIKEFGEEYREKGGLFELLMNQKLMTNLGKLFAADAFIGNGDRLFRPNMGNVAFKADGTLCAIDSATVLTSFDSIVKHVTDEVRNDFLGSYPAEKQEWGQTIVGKHGGLAIPSHGQQQNYIKADRTGDLVVPASFGMEALFNVDDWWETHFKHHLLEAKPTPPPPDRVWNLAKMYFRSGVDEGLKEVDAKLSGFDWLKMKSKYKSYVTKYGGDANLDWTNFKVRRLYFKLRMKTKSEELAIAGVQKYINSKLPS